MCNPQYQLRETSGVSGSTGTGGVAVHPMSLEATPCILGAIALKSIYKHKIELNFGANSQNNGIKFGAFQPKGVNLHRFHGISF